MIMFGRCEAVVLIRPLEKADFPAVKEIFQQGIDTGHATFRTSAMDWDQFNAVMHEKCRLAATEDGRVIGLGRRVPGVGPAGVPGRGGGQHLCCPKIPGAERRAAPCCPV